MAEVAEMPANAVPSMRWPKKIRQSDSSPIPHITDTPDNTGIAPGQQSLFVEI
jgi:hypothetical protein